ncbi:UbiA family prenyltransferase [bacterium]|nr:UbiA family prenyltransferase [bacterium]
MKKRLFGLLQIIRPVNVVIAMASVLIAMLICNPHTRLRNLVLAMLVAGLVTSGANAINDYFDIEIDRINRPRRPLPAGLLSPFSARRFAFFCFVSALALAAFLGPQSLFIVGLSIPLVYAYSAVFKTTAVWGNLIVGLTSGLAFLFGGTVAGNMQQAWMPFLFALVINWAREVIKDIEDIPGDRQARAQTLPIRYGIPAARRLITALLTGLILLTGAPYLLGLYGRYYLLVVMMLVNSLLITVLVELWRELDSRRLRRMSLCLKAAMFSGLAAILAGQW